MNFIDTFLAEFLASLLVAILGATLIPAYLDWRKKPKLVLKDRMTRSDVCKLTKAQDGQWEGTFLLVIRNNGSVTQRGIYWHLLVPEELAAHVIAFETAQGVPSEILEGAGKTWRHFSGKVTDPVFAKKGLMFPYKVIVKTPSTEPKEYGIYYFFSTEFGTSPASAEKYHEAEAAKGREADDLLDIEDLGKIILRPQQDD